MASYTPDWKNFGFDEEASHYIGDNSVNSFELFGVYPLANQGSPQFIISSILTNYDNDLDDEICYFVTKASGSIGRIWAVRANGPKTGILIDDESILWQTDLTGFKAPDRGFLTLSNDGSTIYVVDPNINPTGPFGNPTADSQLWSIDTSDGSINWVVIDSGVSQDPQIYSIRTPVVLDNNGDIWYFGRRVFPLNPYQHDAYRQKRDPTTGAAAFSFNSGMKLSEPDTNTNVTDEIDFAPSIATDGSGNIYGTFRSLLKNKTWMVKIISSTNAAILITLSDAGNFAEIGSGITVGTDQKVYGTYNNHGLIRVNFVTVAQDWVLSSSHTSMSHPVRISISGTLYYRGDDTVYQVEDLGSSGSVTASASGLPTPPNYDIPPSRTIAPSVNTQTLYVASSVKGTGVDNVHLYTPSDDALTYIESHSLGLGTDRFINQLPTIGGNTQYYYVSVLDDSGTKTGFFYIYGTDIPPTTTTTTTPTTTTTTTPTTTTTTTTPSGPTTTTTTTTTEAPLSVVETLITVEVDGQLVDQRASNASDDDATQGNLFAGALSFDTVAPGETTDNVIISLNIPNSSAIGNVKLGLIDAGGIEFSNGIFGITSSVRLDQSITPDEYFQGVNTDGTASNPNNIAIGNRKSTVSEYVYLNLSLPSDNTLGEGVIRFKWFFDYAD